MRIPLATNSYRSRSLPLSAQRLVNLFPEVQPPDAKAKVALFGTPGLRSFASCGSGPVRGAHVMKGVLYVVSGGSLYSVGSTGNATALGTIGGTGLVTMADNGTQLVVVAPPAGYVWDGSALTAITDEAWPGASSVDYVDGYHVFTRPDSGQFFISDLYDATSYDALDFASAESAPDDTVRVIVSHRELWLFGETSTEVWQNTGGADFPFQRMTTLERGCLAPMSAAKMDNGLFWLGDDGIVYRASGYQPVRISTHAIEHAITEWASPETAEALVHVVEGHTFYALSCGSQTIVYDAATGLWHERQSGLTSARWRASCYAQAYGQHLVGDSLSGAVYELSLDVYDEDGEPIRAEATSPPMHADGKWLLISRVELEMEPGVGLTTGQGSDPQAMLQWSDDGGKTWGNELWRPIGQRGRYRNRAVWHRLGRSRNRVWRVAITDPVPRVLIALIVDAEPGGY